MATGIGTPALINWMTTTPERAIIPPIERSTPPAISTNVSPIARMRKIELDFRRSMKLTSVKNSDLVLGFRLNNAMAITTRMIARNAFWSARADRPARTTLEFEATCRVMATYSPRLASRCPTRSPGSGSRL